MARGRLAVPGLMAVLGLGLLSGGCQPPAEIIPAGEPGFDYVRPAPKEKEEPQAKGETVAQSPSDPARKQAVAGTVSPPTEPGQTRTTPSGVTYETLKPGDGPEVKPGQTVTVHYTGTLSDGKVFDSSRSREEPFTATLDSSGGLIPGWIEGIPGMKVGERRKLTVPAEMGYGEKGNPPTIPGNATLTFEVDLISIK
jgi:FKBP-type peptidyl-prolyl cis-trans isomerase FkpA